MAKVRGPLYSMDARGKLGNSLVYMSWKGIQDVRKYVIPANPRSTGQMTQRGYFSDAVELWHTAGFSVLDNTGWKIFAELKKTALSGFNAFVQIVVKALIAGYTFTPITDVTVSSPTTTGATIEASILSDCTSKIFYGPSKTTMLENASMTYDSGEISVTLTDCVADTTYYFYIQNTKAGESGRTGIYVFKTASA